MAFAYISDSEAVSSNNNSVTTSGVDTSGADLIVLGCTNDGANVVTPTDSKGNTWSPLTQVTTGGEKLKIFYCLNPIVGSGHTFSMSTSGNGPAIAMSAFSGSSAFGQESGTSATQPGSITPAEDNELLVSCASHGAAGTPPTVNSPFSSNLTASLGGGASNYPIGMAYEIQTTATARNPTWTLTASNPCSAMATFKAAVAAGAVRIWQLSPIGDATPQVAGDIWEIATI